MAKRRSRGPPKLPAKQLAILAICRFAEPVSMTSVFPYLPEMIESFGIPQTSVAKWAGITSAVFSLSQCLTAVLWGRASDYFGRKPTILLGLSFTMLASLVWGMSTSLPMAILSRAMAGGCNGNVGIIRTMVAEMVPEKELQPRAFSIMPLVWSLGSIFGPSLGGFFAKPAENLSAVFGGNKFLIAFPFVLPNIISSVLFLLGITTGILFLHETLETRKHKTDYGLVLGSRLVAFCKALFRAPFNLRGKPLKHFRRHSTFDESSAALLRPTSSSASIDSSKPSFDSSFPSPDKFDQPPPKPRPTLKEVFTRQSNLNLAAYTFLALHATAYDQLLPIFLHNRRPEDADPPYPPHSLPFHFSGGFSLESSRIGTLFTLYGICGGLIQFLVFPPVARHYGILRCFKICALTFPLICFLTPFTALIHHPLLQQLAMFAIMLVKSFAVIFAFPCAIILLTNSASSLRILGTLNGFAVSISAIGRAVGPAVGGAAFTWGLEHNMIITAWWLLGLISMLGAIPIWWLVEMPGFSKAGDSDSESEEEEDEDVLDAIEEDPYAEILAGDEMDFEAEDEGLRTVEGPSFSKRRKSLEKKYRSGEDADRERDSRMSSPIGIRGGSVGPGGNKMLSNGLAASNMGQGTGGTSFS